MANSLNEDSFTFSLFYLLYHKHLETVNTLLV